MQRRSRSCGWFDCDENEWTEWVPRGISVIDLPRISPDGSTLAFNATDSSGKAMVWLRPLNSLIKIRRSLPTMAGSICS